MANVNEIIAAYKANKLSRTEVKLMLRGLKDTLPSPKHLPAERRSRNPSQKESIESTAKTSYLNDEGSSKSRMVIPAAKTVKLLAKPSVVSLASLESETFSASDRPSLKKRPLVSLAPLEARFQTDSRGMSTKSDSADVAEVELADYGEGVYALNVGGRRVNRHGRKAGWTESLILGLEESFRIIQAKSDAKAVLLRGGEDLFLPGGNDSVDKEMFFARRLPLLPLCCPVPVIAVMKGHSEGLSWLVGALCDFMICSEESSYRYFEQGTDEELLLFEVRFNGGYPHDLLFSRDGRTGRELRKEGLGMPVVPKHEVDSYALELARQLSQAPRGSLILLKKHLSQEIFHRTENLLSAYHPKSKVEIFPARMDKEGIWDTYSLQVLEDSEHIPDLGESETIRIDSGVVSLEAYPNGIALITLSDKQGKNTFTDELVQGITKAFSEILSNSRYKAVILTGYDHYFSCGGTKEGLLAIQSGKARFTDIGIYSLPLETPIPVIAAMQGHGIGAGWSLGMFCDFVIFSEQHVYISPYMKYGFTPGAGSTLVIPDKLGMDLGREILFTANEYTGAELRQRGIKMPVVPASEVRDFALKMANLLASSSREELEEMKRESRKRIQIRLKQTFAQEQAMHDESFVGKEEVLWRIQQYFNEGTQQDSQNPMQVEVIDTHQDNTILDEIRKTLRRTLAEELFINQDLMDEQMKFIEMGLDSITGVNWVRKLNNEYGLSINATKIYNHPTIREFAKYVMKEGKQNGLFQPEHHLSQDNQPSGEPAARKTENLLLRVKSVHPVFPLLEADPAKHRIPSLEVHVKEQMNSELVRNKAVPQIAVIGMSGQFPKARTLSEYWNNLAEGRDCISEIPATRWDIQQHYDPDPKAPGKTYCKWMGVLDDVALFDPLFFNISPREAEWMDPQQRLFLQSAWHCIEDAGYNSAHLSGSKSGVFVGCAAGDYGQSVKREEFNSQNFMGKAISILAAKISYTLNLQGPCLSIDTACSSSLVAIASACDSLVLGSSDMALAGGVCVMAGPDMHIMTSKAGMLSADGRCFTFDQRANGFVPGEGVGVVLLKRLEDAERDGDHIHGVISGWGVNQDGKTNGITAPNPDSQARLEKEIYEKYFIDPESIQLIEAHGTGTKLGDPIEVEGLKESFKSFTSKTNYCALGSVKSNIGHLLAAAGIAGVIKLLLSLKHRKIPPTIHYKQLNEHIELKNSPFYVNTTCADWAPPENQTRRAAISSLGFSGTNAHIVIEEYVPERQRKTIAVGPSNPAAIILSAKNEDRLKEYAKSLLAYIKQAGHAQIHLADVAYTLQVGRDAMEERLAVKAASLEELQEKLEAFLSGAGEIKDVYRGKVRRDDDTIALFAVNEELQEAVEKWTQPKQLSKLLSLWVKGLTFDWNKLYKHNQVRPCRMSLPVYPFEKKHYWLPEDDLPAIQHGSEAAGLPTPVSQTLNPLLHQNTSTLFSEQRYSSAFTGQEFFFAHHVIKGRRVLPGVGHLEMVRAAVKEACGNHADTTCLQIKNVVWLRPIIAPDQGEGDQTVVIHISLVMEDTGEIAYKIYSEGDHGDGDLIVHSQGVVLFHSPEAIPPRDLSILRAECDQADLDVGRYFEGMKERGANLGPGFRGIDNFYLGANSEGSPQVLTRITIPDSLSEAPDRFVLHPTPMDAAVHTCPPLIHGLEDLGRTPLALPFALDELEVLGNCKGNMWALARNSKGSSAGDQVSKYDIDLCDDQGTICVRFKGFSLRTLEKVEARGEDRITEPKDSAAKTGALMFNPSWRGQAVRAGMFGTLANIRRVIILCELGLSTAIKDKLKDARVLILPSVSQGAEHLSEDQRFRIYATESFNAIKEVFREQVEGRAQEGQALIQIIVPQSLYSGLSGLLKTAQLENPKVIGQVIEVDPEEGIERVVEKIEENSRSPHDVLVRYRAGKRQVLVWNQFETGPQLPPNPWKEQGVYLLTGGAGALGIIFSEEIVKLVKNVTLILTGRSSLNQEKQSRLKALEAMGGEPSGIRIEYRQVDITQMEAVESLLRSIKEKYGRLNGIIHGAGVIRDNFILKKTEKELIEVLAPKVAGVVNLDRASKGLNLDFFVLFSSIASAVGNSGQADYAMANSFLDAYASYRNDLIASRSNGHPNRLGTSNSPEPPGPFGQTLSINWPLWKEGGMVIDEQTEQWMRQNTGLIQMKTSTGIEAFYRALASGQSQIMVTEGEVSQMKQRILGEKEPVSLVKQAPATQAPGVESKDAGEKRLGDSRSPRRFDGVLHALKPVAAKILKIAADEIDIDKELITYGFDSITLTELTNDLNKQYQIRSSRSLNPTLFFEHPTLRSFAKYLAEEYEEIGGALSEAGVVSDASFEKKSTAQHSVRRAETVRQPGLPAARPRPTAKGPHNSANVVPMASSANPDRRTAIAVVGMSGRFPMANDIHEYWQNLVEGRDCISEVPPDRWDWKAIYGDPTKQGNKTDIRWGGFMNGVGDFDPLFFGISPREALLMDPMQRLLMLHIWQAIEDAGYSARSLSGTKTSIFVGTSVTEYGMLLAQANVPFDAFTPTGRSASLGANRMSYFLDLHGPSETVDTACSSSLVAIHRAVMAMENGQCDMALVGGVNTLIAPDGHVSFRKAGMLCEDGRCKTFSKQANGYARGEGVGILFLRKLSDAERSRDNIYGVIKGSGENHGGRANSLTAPNPKAQADLLKTVYTEAEIDPRSVSYIEAHGTGTELGDPVEVNGLKMAFKDLYQATGDSKVTEAHCGLGSVKSNIGHLELAAGAAGAIKVLLQLKHKTLVKSLHCEEINPYIQLQGTPFHIVRETKEWVALKDSQGREIPRRAGVSSFGFGGANAHIIFEEYLEPGQQGSAPIDVPPHNPGGRQEHLIVLSAKNADRLKEAARQLFQAVTLGKTIRADGSSERFQDADLVHIAYTLQVGREAMEERLGMKVNSLQELREKLELFLSGKESGDLYRGKVKRNDEILSLFTDDEELQEAVEKWVSRRKIAKLLSLWIKGANFDWSRLYVDHNVLPRRVSLPAYPFAKERYWPEVDASGIAPTRTNPVGTSESMTAPEKHGSQRTTCFLKKDWKLSELQIPAFGSVPTVSRPFDGTVIILATEETVTLAARLIAHVPNSQIVNLSDSQHFELQFRQLADSEALYAGCIDLTGCGTQKVDSLAWMAWLQQLIGKKSTPGQPMMLLCVTRGLESFSSDSINLAGATHAGLYRMLQSEYAKLRSRHMDAESSGEDTVLAKQIAAEWMTNCEDTEICYRAGSRYSAVLQEFVAPTGQNPLTFPDGRVLWITGGTRGIGFLCAEHFVKNHGVKKLVLTGREAIPPRAQWKELSENRKPETSSVVEKIEALEKLERLGVQVEMLSVSLSDAHAVKNCLQHIKLSMGPIGGVIHCAGVNDWENPAFVRKSMAGILRVLEPKVAGLDVLLQCLGNEPLQFFVLFSSVTAVIPTLGAGQSDYALANAYMDYVAEAHKSTHSIVSIQWPSWKETGMGEANTRAYKNTGLLSHTDKEGLQLLDCVLSNRLGPVILPAVVDPNSWKPHRLMQRFLEDRAATPSEPERAANTSKAAPLSTEDSQQLSDATLAWLMNMFSRELMIAPDKLDKEVPFQDYGVDSIMLVQLLRRIEESLNTGGDKPIDPSIFYEYPTLASFASWLIRTHAQSLENVLGSSVSNAGATASAAAPSAATPETQPEVLEPPRETRSQTVAKPEVGPTTTDIAVIGLSCQFPGASDLDAYWRLLLEGRSAIRSVPQERWGRPTHRHAGLIDNVTHFDPAFFLIADNDARAMDPQALLLLEESLKVFHHAGYSLQGIKGTSTGVFIGARSNHQPQEGNLLQARNPIVAVGQNYLAANISQFFDLQGPSLVLDTACSSALVNMNMAIQSLQSGEITSALVGGISLLHTDAAHRLFERRNLLSRDSAFHVFDRRASGVVLGEGVGMVLLKTVERALEEGDQIHAVIKALAINNDGRTAGPASPNLQAQKAVMKKALNKSGKRPEEISYLELNGSGSEVTDLLELKAVESVYRPAEGAQAPRVPCELGSMEPNIGHPLCAKGIASFIKTVLMLSHRHRVPFLSGEQPMTHYDIASSPFYFRRELSDWTTDPQIAAINCFADGGTNAHVILESWNESVPRSIKRFPITPPKLNRREIYSVQKTSEESNVWSREPVSDPAQLLISIDHPILKNHKAYGQELLPGLAYIDIVYQYFRQKGYPHHKLELRNLSIYHPLVVSKDYDVLLDIQCSESKEGSWQIHLEGQEKRGETFLSDKKRYAVAEMHQIAPVHFEETLSLDAIKRSAQKTLDLEELYAQCRLQSLVHTGCIKAKGQLHEAEAASCIDISVGPEARSTAHEYMFHPTLIDGSSVGAQRLFASMFEGEKRLILPLFYESFRASSLLQKQCVSRIQTASLRRKNELLYMTLEFFNESGTKVAELKNYACKLVRDEGAINPNRKENASRAENAVPKMELEAARLRPMQAESASQVRNETDDEAYAGAESFLVQLMAERLNLSVDQIDTQLGYYELGLDSARLLDLVGALESKIGDSLAPTLLFEYTTISELAKYLTEKYPSSWGQAAATSPSTQRPASTGIAPASLDMEVNLAPKSAAKSRETEDEIAIIGMAGRYPGANTVQEFWINLTAGKDCITEVPRSRWERHQLDGVKSPSGKAMSQWGGFIEDPDCFDAQFFRISPWEAKLIDPQQRLFMEVCWEAIEDAGYTPKTLVSPRGRNQRRDVGVYVGVMHNDYAMLGADAVSHGEKIPVSLNYAQIANRVSYFCNFHGPSMAIDTVCSSSLIAVHLALESIHRGECEVALAGGVNLSVHPNKYMTYGMMDMHSSDGRCRAFGKGGDGYVSGEGIGAVLLKPLSRAIRDNDHIYAIIKGSTTNHVGTVSGLTVPSPVAQADMIETCLEKTGTHPRTISYVEAHGTGTSLGDPIEVQGLVKAFSHYTADRQFCSIGSVKSNIGHAESAAGISGLSKIALQLHYKTLVPSLHSNDLNPYLDFENSPFYVQHKTEEWKHPVIRENGREVRYPRRAALSSFGASGSNAHLILEEYVAKEAEESPLPIGLLTSRPAVIPLSAKNQDRLNAYVKRMLEYLRNPASDIDLSNLAYTLQVGREAMEERVAFVAADVPELIEKMKAFVKGEPTQSRADSPYYRGSVQKGKKPPSLSSQGDQQDVVGRWISEGTIFKVPEMWVQGFAFDWEAVHRLSTPHGHPQRMSLPTYPFAKERHWLDAPKAGARSGLPPASADNREVVYFTSRWRPRSIDSTASGSRPKGVKTTVFVATDNADNTIEKIEQLNLADRVFQLPTSDDIAAQVQSHTIQLFQYCKSPDLIKRSEHELLIVYVPYRGSDYPYRCLMGTLRTITLEFPFIKTKLVFDSALASNSLEAIHRNLSAEINHRDPFTEIVYTQDQLRQVLTQEVIEPGSDDPEEAIKENLLIRHSGVYLITGGLGGLGALFAEHLGQGTESRFILTGRSLLTAKKKALLASLESKGLNVEYFSCDTRRKEEVQKVVDHVVGEYGTVHGVIHSAGVLFDNFIPKKTEAEIVDVLSAKVHSAINLDEATKDLALDFFVSFSSLASLGNPGQLDYATANAFLDAFALRREGLAARGERKGKSLSINWPLWKDGGMSVNPEYEKFMFENFGVVPLRRESGINAFMMALASREHQLGVMEGYSEKIRRLLTRQGVEAQAVDPLAGKNRKSTQKKIGVDQKGAIESVVLQGIAESLGMEMSAIDPRVEFVEYGMDSIGATKVANFINQQLGLDYTGAVFLELNSAEKLIDQLYENEINRLDQTGPSEPPGDGAASFDPVVERNMPTPARLAPGLGYGKIGIVGFDARLPGATNVEEYWQNLSKKAVSIRKIPPDQWEKRGVALKREGKDAYASMQYSALMDHIDSFDADFWGISEEAARQMDPQQRLLLQSIWHCIEHAGYSMKQLAQQKVGLFLAIDSLDYRSALRTQKNGIGVGAGVSVGIIANQISYFCNFRGPSEVIDNACASTYVALKRASQAIAMGDCETAIVGGTKILLDPVEFMGRDQGEILTHSGNMYPFDAKADGYVRGEGVGCLLLKSLEQAEKDGDTVHAVIAGIGVSHNGRNTLSQSAPSVEGQYQAVREAYKVSGVAPETVNYIEAHGTANNFSDASEVAAFKQFFKEALDSETYQNHRCAISTVKGNVGHLEGASGIASLIKALCAIRHKKIPPIATLSKIHPSILISNSPFYFPTDLTDWESVKALDTSGKQSSVVNPRRVGLHSIGIGGVNAHVILEEYMAHAEVASDKRATTATEGEGYELVMVSARSKSALEAYCKEWHQHLSVMHQEGEEAQTDLADIAYSSQIAREAMPYRAVYVVDNIQDLLNALERGVDCIEQCQTDTTFAATNLARPVFKEKAEIQEVSPSHSLVALRILASAWLEGKSIDWKRLSKHGGCHFVKIPNYPFQNRKIWYSSPPDPFADLFYETFAPEEPRLPLMIN